MSAIRTVVVPAAGFGTRLLPATRHVPKELLPLLDRPALQWIAEEAATAGISRLLLITSPHKPALDAHFRATPALQAALQGRAHPALDALEALAAQLTIETVTQEEARGLGHAVLCAEAQVGDEPFAVILPDDIYVGTPSAIGGLLEAEGHVVGYLEVPRAETGRYGIIAPGATRANGDIEVEGFIEKPDPETAPSTMAALGRYRLEPSIFGYLHQTRPGAGGEIQLTDALAAAARDGLVLARALSGERLDTGTTLGWLEANLRLGLRDPRYRARLLRVADEESTG